MRLVWYDPAIHQEITAAWWTQEFLSHFPAEQPASNKGAVFYLVFIGDKPVGWVEAFNIDPDHRKCEVGIGFPEKAGRGAVAAAGREFARLLFGEMGLNRLTARVLAENRDPERLLEWLGFLFEGVERKGVCRDGVFRDIHIYGLLRDDFEQRHGKVGR